MIISGNHFYVDRYRGAIEAITEYGITPAWLRFVHACGLNECLQKAGCDYQLPPYEFFENADTEFIEEHAKELLSNIEKVAEYAEMNHLKHMTMFEAFIRGDELLYSS